MPYRLQYRQPLALARASHRDQRRAVPCAIGRRQHLDRPVVSQRRHSESFRISLSVAGHPQRRAARSLVDLDHRRHHRHLPGRPVFVCRAPGAAAGSWQRLSQPVRRRHAHLLCAQRGIARDLHHAHRPQSSRRRRATCRSAPTRGRRRSHRPDGPAGVRRGARTGHAAGNLVRHSGRLATDARIQQEYRSAGGNR